MACACCGCRGRHGCQGWRVTPGRPGRICIPGLHQVGSTGLRCASWSPRLGGWVAGWLGCRVVCLIPAADELGGLVPPVPRVAGRSCSRRHGVPRRRPSVPAHGASGTAGSWFMAWRDLPGAQVSEQQARAARDRGLCRSSLGGFRRQGCPAVPGTAQAGCCLRGCGAGLGRGFGSGRRRAAGACGAVS